MSGMFLKDMYYAHKLTSVGVYNGSFTEMKKQLETTQQFENQKEQIFSNDRKK